MKKTTFYCDRCKAEIPKDRIPRQLNVGLGPIDLEEKCFFELLEWLKLSKEDVAKFSK